MSKDVPTAKVVEDGKLGGDVPRASTAGGGGGASHKRRVSNFLLDKKLQLRYVLLVTAVSAVISGALGWLIYRQEKAASQGLAKDLTSTFGDAELQASISSSLQADDSKLLLTMVGVGIGLVVVLSLYLVVMTHKVAGPLYKVSLHFDDMARGKLSQVAGPRRGDMLQDFYGNFRDMHEAVRGRVAAEADQLQKLLDACAAAGISRSDEPGATLGQLETHVQRRRTALR